MYIITLFLVSLIIFVVIRVMPGDPAQIILGTEATPAVLERLRDKLGLNEPMIVQYLDWLEGALTGNFGVSINYDVPISDLIASRLLVTGPLTALAIFFTIILGIPLGIYAGVHRNSIRDYGIIVISQLGIAMPAFWTGILLILLFSVRLRWFPAGGFTTWSEDPLAALESLLLPALALSGIRIALITRIMRSSLIDVLGEDYVRMARSKGLTERIVIYKHAVRNSLISVITVLGLQVGMLLAGAIIIESVFYLPGMGRLLVLAIQQRDLPVVQGIVFFMASVVILVNFVVDISYGILDPRIGYE